MNRLLGSMPILLESLSTASGEKDIEIDMVPAGKWNAEPSEEEDLDLDNNIDIQENCMKESMLDQEEISLFKINIDGFMVTHRKSLIPFHDRFTDILQPSNEISHRSNYVSILSW